MKKILALLLVFAFACAPIQPTLTPEQDAVLAMADSTQVDVDSLRVVFEADAKERAKDKAQARNTRLVTGITATAVLVAFLIAN